MKQKILRGEKPVQKRPVTMEKCKNYLQKVDIYDIL